MSNFVSNRNFRNEFVIFFSIRQRINSKKIKNILILHEKLCSICKIINKIYSFSILCVITLQFLITLNLVFYIIVVMLYENVLPVVYIMNTIFSTTSMSAVVIISSLTSEEVKKATKRKTKLLYYVYCF